MADSFTLPAGYGFRRLTKEELRLRDHLLETIRLYEYPRQRGPRQYILGVDVSDGLGLDRAVIDVHRMGTIEEPEEQVAVYSSDTVAPAALAFIVDAVGRLYADADRYEALAAIECNNHGLSTQDTLQLHLGYTHFYRWEYLDAASPQSRYSTKIGWVTTPRTRPMLLDKLQTALSTIDPITHQTELLIHDPMTRAELADFQTEGALWEAAAARGAYDDHVMACAIARYVSWRLQGGEQEPLDERRARRHQEAAARAQAGTLVGQAKRDWRNTACSADEAQAMVDEESMDVFDDRGAPAFLR